MANILEDANSLISRTFYQSQILSYALENKGSRHSLESKEWCSGGRSFTKCSGSIWLYSEKAKDRTRWVISLETKEREGRALVDKEGRKRKRKRERIMSHNPRKDRSLNKMKSSRRLKLAEKHAIIPVNAELSRNSLEMAITRFYDSMILKRDKK